MEKPSPADIESIIKNLDIESFNVPEAEYVPRISHGLIYFIEERVYRHNQKLLERENDFMALHSDPSLDIFVQSYQDTYLLFVFSKKDTGLEHPVPVNQFLWGYFPEEDDPSPFRGTFLKPDQEIPACLDFRIFSGRLDPPSSETPPQLRISGIPEPEEQPEYP